MDIIETLKQQQAAKTEQNFDAYRDLLQASLVGELDAKAQTRLSKLIDELGFNVERVEGDLTALREAAQCEQTIAGRHEANQALATARESLQKLRDDWQEAFERQRERENEAVGEVTRAESVLAPINRAVERLAQLKRDHHRILDSEDPETTARRRHVLSVLTRKPEGAKYLYLELESCMRGQSMEHVDVDSIEFAPLPDQSREEMAELIGKLREIKELYRKEPNVGADRLRAVYVTATAAIIEGYPERQDVMRSVDQIAQSDIFDTAKTLLFRHPAHTIEEHAAFVETIKRAHFARDKKAAKLAADSDTKARAVDQTTYDAWAAGSRAW